MKVFLVYDDYGTLYVGDDEQRAESYISPYIDNRCVTMETWEYGERVEQKFYDEHGRLVINTW